MTTIRFYLRTEKRNQPAPIYVRLRTASSDVACRLDKYILPDIWDKKKAMPKPVSRTLDPEGYEKYQDLCKYIQTVRDNLADLAEQYQSAGKTIRKEDIESILTPKAQRQIPRDIVAYWRWLIREMEAGTFLKPNSEPYSPATIKTWKGACSTFRAFAESYPKPITWDTLDKPTMDAFVDYLERHGYLPKSINKFLTQFRIVVRFSARYHNLHNNTRCIELLGRRTENDAAATAKTYLTASEVQALFDMPLEPGSLKDKVRDLFLVGVYTCQRVSDYAHNIKPSCITATRKGTRVVRLTQQKTGAGVVIPILNDNLLLILAKYNYNLPDLGEHADVVINEHIKEILRDLSANVPSLKEPVKTVLTLRERRLEDEGKASFDRDAEGNVLRPKYETVCTHTARRTGITNLYLLHKLTTRQLMSISGHKTEQNFYLYIRQSSDELAEEIAALMEGDEEIF